MRIEASSGVGRDSNIVRLLLHCAIRVCATLCVCVCVGGEGTQQPDQCGCFDKLQAYTVVPLF